MRTVNVNKDKLYETVGVNRDKHRVIFEEAIVGYREEAVRLLDEHIKRIQKGKLMRVYVALPMPEDHTKDYDRVLRMLEMSVNDTITLEQAEFAQYVMDDWAWKRDFLTTASIYNSSNAVAALEEQSVGAIEEV